MPAKNGAVDPDGVATHYLDYGPAVGGGAGEGPPFVLVCVLIDEFLSD